MISNEDCKYCYIYYFKDKNRVIKYTAQLKPISVLGNIHVTDFVNNGVISTTTTDVFEWFEGL